MFFFFVFFVVRMIDNIVLLYMICNFQVVFMRMGFIPNRQYNSFCNEFGITFLDKCDRVGCDEATGIGVCIHRQSQLVCKIIVIFPADNNKTVCSFYTKD